MHHPAFFVQIEMDDITIKSEMNRIGSIVSKIKGIEN